MKKLEYLLDKFFEISDKIGKHNVMLIAFIVIVLIITGLYSTFSIFTSTDGVDVVDGLTTYKFVLDPSLSVDSVIVPANSEKNLDVVVTNSEAGSLKYGLYYSATGDITLGYIYATTNAVSGVIESNGVYVVSLKAINSTSSNVTISFGLAYGFENGGDLALPDGKQWIDQCVTNIFAETIMAPNAISDDILDFSQTSDASGTNGIYMVSETTNDAYPIYYYRGNVNNNLIFANTCWKVVRTTETGGLKLIYNGVPTNGQCNNTGAASQIGTNIFNSAHDSPAYVGYMYSNVYSRSWKDLYDSTDTYYYANDVTYSNGTYTLVDSDIKSGVLSDIYSELGNYHYTCFSTSKTCENVYYMYYIDGYDGIYYITLTDGKKVGDALTEMLGADDENTDNYNTISSVIKGNKDSEGTIDWWYYNNIEQKGYSSYVEDTVWCNDRTISSLGAWDPDGGSLYYSLRFSAYERTYTTHEPSLTCTRKIDSFTVNEENGNGDLDYPVGLLTNDEIMLAGGIYSTNKTYYLNSGRYYWAGSPVFFDYLDGAFVSVVGSDGYLYGASSADYDCIVDVDSSGVRPSVSLKPGFSLTGNGDGTAANPYVVE